MLCQSKFCFWNNNLCKRTFGMTHILQKKNQGFLFNHPHKNNKQWILLRFFLSTKKYLNDLYLIINAFQVLRSALPKFNLHKRRWIETFQKWLHWVFFENISNLMSPFNNYRLNCMYQTAVISLSVKQQSEKKEGKDMEAPGRYC